MKDSHATSRSGLNNETQGIEHNTEALIAHLGGMVRGASLQAQTKSCPATHEQIERRAYDIYSKTGSVAGHCEHNWNQAEKELRREVDADNAAPEKSTLGKLPPFDTQRQRHASTTN